VPEPLLAQLAIGGRLVVPIGPPERQRLRVIRRRKTDYAQEDGEFVVFVPLVGKFGRAGVPG
jgi:protein-L-isoaspartate O-methyltransferase